MDSDATWTESRPPDLLTFHRAPASSLGEEWPVVRDAVVSLAARVSPFDVGPYLEGHIDGASLLATVHLQGALIGACFGTAYELAGERVFYMNLIALEAAAQGRGLSYDLMARTFRHVARTSRDQRLYCAFLTDNARLYAPHAEAFFHPKVGRALPPDCQQVGAALMARLFPDQAFDPATGVLSGTGPNGHPVPRHRDGAIQGFFDDRLDYGRGDDLLVIGCLGPGPAPTTSPGHAPEAVSAEAP